jgi:hypothetical protein
VPNLPPTIKITPTPIETGAGTITGKPGAPLAADAVPNQVDQSFRALTSALGATVPANVNRARTYIGRMGQAVR